MAERFQRQAQWTVLKQLLIFVERAIMFAPPHSFSVRALDKKQQQPEGHDCVFVAKGERSRYECAGMRGRSLT